MSAQTASRQRSVRRHGSASLDLFAALVLRRASRVCGRRHDIPSYLAHVQGGISIKAVARVMRAPPSRVRRQIAAIEDRRDDPVFDHFTETLAEGMRVQ